MEINTDTYGPKLTLTTDFTKKMFIELCDKISNKLNKFYNLTDNDKIIISPEPITEGGLRFYYGKNWEYGTYNIRDKSYKTIRCSFFDKNKKKLDYPFITENTHSEWKNSDQVLYTAGSTSTTVLKAFQDAPQWIIEELLIFKKCFEKFNIKCTKMPAKKHLSN